VPNILHRAGKISHVALILTAVVKKAMKKSLLMLFFTGIILSSCRHNSDPKSQNDNTEVTSRSDETHKQENVFDSSTYEGSAGRDSGYNDTVSNHY
jgi:hypothetical protein